MPNGFHSLKRAIFSIPLILLIIGPIFDHIKANAVQLVYIQIRETITKDSEKMGHDSFCSLAISEQLKVLQQNVQKYDSLAWWAQFAHSTEINRRRSDWDTANRLYLEYLHYELQYVKYNMFYSVNINQLNDIFCPKVPYRTPEFSI